jgi:hypothetical protein
MAVLLPWSLCRLVVFRDLEEYMRQAHKFFDLYADKNGDKKMQHACPLMQAKGDAAQP